MKAQILTLFPEMFPGALGHGLMGKGLTDGKWSFTATNIRDFATDVHKTVDDTPFGGGAGMVLKPDILSQAIDSLPEKGRRLYLSPRGRVLSQELVKELSQESVLTLLCGRYEGVDQRILDAYDFEEVSIGDYILCGGEVAAHVLLEAVLRYTPGILGNAETLSAESFENNLLEYPHYTRPANWLDKDGKMRQIPPVLASGHHKNIEAWRREQAETLTKERRPDLWQRYKNAKKRRKNFGN